MLLLLLTVISCTQQKKVQDENFLSFIDKFPKAQLPFCVDYSMEEESYFIPQIAGEDSVLIEDEDSSFYDYELIWEEQGDFPYNETDKLDIDYVAKFLLPADSNVSITEENISYADANHVDVFYSESVIEYLKDSEFYPVALLTSTEKYYIIVFNRFLNQGYPGSEKYLCTVSKNGKFISSVLIASLAHAGSGISNHGQRIPWYPKETGCIDADLNITFNSEGTYTEKKYTINKDGKISLIE